MHPLVSRSRSLPNHQWFSNPNCRGSRHSSQAQLRPGWCIWRISVYPVEVALAASPGWRPPRVPAIRHVSAQPTATRFFILGSASAVLRPNSTRPYKYIKHCGVNHQPRWSGVKSLAMDYFGKDNEHSHMQNQYKHYR